MRTWAFPANIEKVGEEDYLVTFSDVPEAMSGGRTLEEVRINAVDALEEAVLAYLAMGRPVPLPREARDGEEVVVLDPLTAARAALATAMREKEISHVALAKALGKSEKAVRRLTDGSSVVKFNAVLDAMNAVGARAVLATA